MTVRVFLSHASADKPLVSEVKRFLDDGGDFDCWLDAFEIGFGENIVSRIEDGLAKSDVVLLFLSPESLKSRWVEEEWTAKYWEQVNSGTTRLVPVLIGDCQPPRLLRNKKYCDLRTNRLEGMRELKTELLHMFPRPAQSPSQAASLPYFVGREAELEELKERLSQPGALVPVIGMPGIGKTYLAREFIRRHASLFEPVYELQCEKKDLAAMATELASLAGLRLEGEAVRVAAELRQYLSGKRCLLLLDNVENDQAGELVPGGRASVVVTARDGTIPFLAEYPELRPPLFGEREALELFRRVLGEVPEDSAHRLFERLGYLPIALAVAAGLIRHDVRHTVESLAAELPALDSFAHGKKNVGRLLKEALASLKEQERMLLVAMAACAPTGVRLGFAGEVAELDEPATLEALQGLYSRSLVVEMDRTLRRYRIHPLIREAATPSDDVRRRHAERVWRGLEAWHRSPLENTELIDEAEQAGRVVPAESSWKGCAIALEAGSLSRALGRLSQAYDFYTRAEQVAERGERRDWLQTTYGNQGVILHEWGRLEEAMTLHKKKEAICLELGDRAALQTTYGNQALILQDWGRLEEAMTLHKKKEAICLELGDGDGLQRTYGNQAGILSDWGRPDEAMALYKNQEAICHQLGNRSGLQRTYAGQALILSDWGRLEEAMALHKKEEAICLELGDRDGLQRTYGNQGLILQDWGRLEEAMALHKKAEAICLELGNRASLAYCYWSMGLLEQSQGRRVEGRGRLREALAIFTELNMPRERDAVQASQDADSASG
jgi:tetratricopeptide (TPR) repeat protein